MTVLVQIRDAGKAFVIHGRGSVRLPVVTGVTFEICSGECVVLAGPSGTGKSSILKMIYGNYRCDSGAINIWHESGITDMATAGPRQILERRHNTIGYVSQFLRALPRIPAIDIVAEPLISHGEDRGAARAKAGAMLRRLNISERLWPLPPSTFSGGEQQRVNIARGFICQRSVLLLDEPTASLDAINRAATVELIREMKQAGAGILAIVHDDDVRNQIADRIIDIADFAAAA